MKNTMISLSFIAALAAGNAMATDAPAPAPTPAKAGEQMMPPKGGENHGAKMFDETDANHDGALSKEEWQAKGDKMFAEIDGNKDSKLSQDEMKAHHEKKRAAWKERREERKEKMGEMKEKMQERMEHKAGAAAPATDAVKH